MLNELFIELTAMYTHRVFALTIYSDYGHVVDSLIREYLDAGGEYRIVRKLENLAYNKAAMLMDEGYM